MSFKRKTMRILVLLMVTLIALSACSKKDTKQEIDNQAEKTPDKVAEEAMSKSVDSGKEEVSEEKEQVNEQTDQKEQTAQEEQSDQTEDMNGWSFKTTGGVASTPVLVNDIIYFGSKDGNFYAVDRNTHEEVWKFNTGNPILCQAAVLEDTIFFSSNDVFYAVDTLTGAERWSYDTKADPMLTRRRDQWDYHDSSPVIDQGVVYFGSSTGKLLGFDAATGELVWEHNTDMNILVRSTPLIKDGVIYCGDWLGGFQAVEIKSKQVLWQNKYRSSFQSSFAANDDVLIIGGRDTEVHALKLTTGEELWSFKDPNGSWITGDPVIVEDIVYIPTSDAKKVYALSITDGTLISSYPIYMNSFTKAIIDNGLLYVTSGDAYMNPGSGKLEVFKLDQPEKSIWEVGVFTGGIFTSPLIADGVVYFGSEDRCLYGVTIPDIK